MLFTDCYRSATAKSVGKSTLQLVSREYIKEYFENEDPFVSCWIKCGIVSLIDSILLQNNILPNPVHALSSIRSLKQKDTSQFVDKIISETGIERATSSLLPRMLKSTCGFSDMIEKNQTRP